MERHGPGTISEQRCRLVECNLNATHAPAHGVLTCLVWLVDQHVATDGRGNLCDAV